MYKTLYIEFLVTVYILWTWYFEYVDDIRNMLAMSGETTCAILSKSDEEPLELKPNPQQSLFGVFWGTLGIGEQHDP